MFILQNHGILATLTQLQVSIGVLLGIAAVVAGGRVFTRFYNPRSFAVDDGFFCLAIITLIAGTTVLYLDVPYLYLQENVEAGLRAPPADFVSQLIHDEKLQNAATTLLGTTIMSVKFSFLFFFRHLIQRQKKLLIWWWCIFAFLIPTAAIVIFSDFIACPYSDARILGQSSLSGTASRQWSFMRFLSSQVCHACGSCQAKCRPESLSGLGHYLGCVS